MKIISKYKDFYDHLTGVYGEDPKLILDRRRSEKFIIPALDSILCLTLGGWNHIGISKNGKIYWGDSIGEICDLRNNKKYKRAFLPNIYMVFLNGVGSTINTVPVKDKLGLNELTECPIVLSIRVDQNYSRGTSRFIYPNLIQLGIPSYLDASYCFLKISDWISNQISLKESQVPEASNEIKIINSGFDLKDSFRNNKNT